MPRNTRIQAELDANPSGFIAGVNKASRHLDSQTKRWQRSVAGFSRGFAGVLAGAGAGLVGREIDQLATNTVRAADEIGKAAKTAGIGAESLQEYRYAAELAGNSQKQFDDAVGRFNRRLGEARNGNKAYADSFAKLGVSITDTNEQALDKTFKSLAGITDETVRTSFATKVFGDDARRMALIVRDGADALEQAKKQARDYGIVIDKNLIASAERAQDTLTTMDNVLDAKLKITVLENLPGLISFKRLMNDISLGALEAAAGVGGFVDNVKRLLNLRVSDEIEDLRIQYADLGVELKKTNKDIGENFKQLNNPIGFISARGQAKLEENLKRVAVLEAKRAKLLAEIRSKEQEIQAIEAEAAAATSAGLNANAFAGGKTPGIPSLKSDVFAKDADAMRDRVAAIVERMQTPLDKLKKDYAEIKALQPFAETPEQVNALAEAAARLQKQMRDVADETDAAKQAGLEFGRGLSDSLAGAAIYGDNLFKSLSNIVKQLAFKGLSNFLFNALSGGSGGLFGGFRAAGGPVSAGKSYIVGENGPEMFSPGVAGVITPNGGGSGGGLTVNVYNSFPITVESVKAVVEREAPRIAASVSAAVERARIRPGYA
ncbi:hypothetical protein [Hyphococcus sp.]|uniref:hypothetical protein n=1 Tax=Hyphococcus sp. TaxID=2038636 RepID=UPI002087EC05|nr:MAG: hypothetical protein DHS20C04_30750 [Marinicaulis sp.]